MREEKTQFWIERCLKSENSDSSLKILNQEDIEDLTNELLFGLRTIFKQFVQAFNKIKKENEENYQKKPNGEKYQEKLKGSLLLYDLAESKGFMLFRKGYRLVFSYVRPGCIKIQLLKQKPFEETEVFAENYIKAVFNNTMSINWIHEQHKGFVEINILARYYMRRFLQIE